MSEFKLVNDTIGSAIEVDQDDLDSLASLLSDDCSKKYIQKYKMDTVTTSNNELLHTSTMYRILRGRCV